MHGFQNHGQNRQQYPNCYEYFKYDLGSSTKLTGKNQCMHFLAEGAAFVEFFEFRDSRNDYAKEFQDSQQTQEPQNS